MPMRSLKCRCLPRLLSKRLVIAFLAWTATIAPTLLHAEDAIRLRNGTQISGTILSEDSKRLVMRVGKGTIVYPKRAISRIYDDITVEQPLEVILSRDKLPPWWIPVSDLYHEDWVHKLRVVKPMEHPSGPFRLVPYLSLVANNLYQLNIYGDPKDPAAIQIGLRRKILFGQSKAEERCREFLVSYLSGLNQIRTLYNLSNRGGHATVDNMTIEVNGPSQTNRGWWVCIYNPQKLRTAQLPNTASWLERCQECKRILMASTEGKTQWEKQRIQEVLSTILPHEQTRE